MAASPCLVGDIGGTNARFAIADRSADTVRLREPQSFLCADFDRAEAAIDHYLETTGAARPADCVLAVAGPVEDGVVDSTNGAWRVSQADLRRHGFSRARVINDYEAQALSIGALQPQDMVRIGPDLPIDRRRTAAIFGAGTGFGAAALATDGLSVTPATTEAGHAGFAPTDEVEIELLRLFIRWHGRCSIERILSGPGIADLHRALGVIDGAEPPPFQAPQILEAAANGDPSCRRTVDRFVAIYGSVAGDIALTVGARGGVYLAGGIAPRLLDELRTGGFRERFEAKGRFSAYMAAIPTHVVVHPYGALLGAARAPLPPV